MDLKNLYSLYLQNRLVSTDTRNIPAGSVFFALKGDKFNGNEYAVQALEKGAIAAVVDEDVPASKGIIKVENVLQTLQDLARYHRRQAGLKILAITGSNGKTTTKELCRAVLSQKYRVSATQGNLNNHIGVPLTLLSLGSDTGVGVIEMGANHPGEIKTLADIAEPDCGVITNIGKAHLEGFGGIEGVATAKSELFNHLVEHNKTILLNEGSPLLLPRIPAGYTNVVRYNGNNGWRILKADSNPFLALRVTNGTNELEIHTRLAGRYNAENVLAALCAGQVFGVSPDLAVKAIESYEPGNNRSQIIKTLRNTVFMDAYNANPSSMAAAVSEFLKTGATKTMLILGEMREVGADSASEHAEIIRLLKENGCSNVYCIGSDFQKPATDAGYNHYQTVDQLIELFTANPPEGYYILVKGSRSNKLERILECL